MNRVFASLLVACLPLLAGCVAPHRGPSQPHPLGWIEGHWVGEGLGGEVEEVWLRERGGAMTCVFRMLEGGTVKFYELVTIERTDTGSGYQMRLKHFAADLRGWEERDEVLVWPLEDLQARSATFGPVTYAADGPDRLIATVRMQEGEHVETARIEMQRKR